MSLCLCLRLCTRSQNDARGFQSFCSNLRAREPWASESRPLCGSLEFVLLGLRGGGKTTAEHLPLSFLSLALDGFVDKTVRSLAKNNQNDLERSSSEYMAACTCHVQHQTTRTFAFTFAALKGYQDPTRETKPQPMRNSNTDTQRRTQRQTQRTRTHTERNMGRAAPRRLLTAPVLRQDSKSAFAGRRRGSLFSPGLGSKWGTKLFERFSS